MKIIEIPENINELINTCPILNGNQSNRNYLLFFSNTSIPNPKTIN